MNRVRNTDPQASRIAQLQEQLEVAINREKSLMEQNKQHQKRIVSLASAEYDIAQLQAIIREQSAELDVLHKELQISQSAHTQWGSEKNELEKQIVDLKGILADSEKQLSAEKILREHKENELRRFLNIETDNKKLTSQVQALQHDVAVLTGRNMSASERLEQQKQLLLEKDTERDKMTEKYKKLKARCNSYNEEVKKLLHCQEFVDKAKQKSEELRKEIEIQKDQNQIHQDNISCLKRQIKNLVSERNELKLVEIEMICQMDEMRIVIDAQNLQIELHKSEAFKQSSLISKLQSDANIGNKVKRKLEKNVDETMQRIKDQDQEINDLKTEIRDKRNEQTEMKIQMTVLKTERDHTLENLFRAQREIDLLTTRVEKQQQEIQARTLDQKKMGRELDNVKRDLKLEEEKYRVILTEKGRLERELQLSTHQVSQQQHTITIQKAATDSLEQTVKTLREEVESFTLHNREFDAETDRLKEALEKLLRQKIVLIRDRARSGKRVYESTFLLYKYRQRYQKERRVQRQVALVVKQREEIEELKLLLAQRPDNVVVKLMKSQWDNRELKKQLMALKGEKVKHEVTYQPAREENKKVTEGLSEMEVDASHKLKAEHQGEPPQLSRHTRFPLCAYRTPSQSEDESSRVPVLPPLTKTTQPCVRKLVPRPPPPSTPKSTPDLKMRVRRVLPPQATPVRK
ncbi:hypothetical protein ABVT39_002562 [Epinephelus coioides]